MSDSANVEAVAAKVSTRLLVAASLAKQCHSKPHKQNQNPVKQPIPDLKKEDLVKSGAR